jgi:hypothetical protein
MTIHQNLSNTDDVLGEYAREFYTTVKTASTLA